jgi:hypothetical protein
VVVHRDSVLLGVVVVAVVGVLAAAGWLFWPQSDSSYLVARGVVLQTAQCGPPEARDSLRVELLDGRAIPAQLDGCGNLPGEVLSVEVPDPIPKGPLVVRLAGTGVPAAVTYAQRVAAVLVVAAGLAGAVLAWRLRPQRR